MNGLAMESIIKQCLIEDIGTGDITTDSLVPQTAVAKGIIHAKQPGVIAGITVAETVFKQIDKNLVFTAKVKDGEQVNAGTVLAEIEGSARGILSGERLALNFLQRMSGIASFTFKLAERIRGYKAKIVDTRKTTPGLRMFEKYAVTMGGGFNHRFGLYDGVLIKDNHIQVAGGIARAILAVKERLPHMVKIEVEVEDIAGVKEALEAGADIIMLDNMSEGRMREAVQLIAGRAIVEASGGMDENKLVAAAKAGVDIISVGALTHSYTAMDISLDIGQIKVGNEE